MWKKNHFPLSPKHFFFKKCVVQHRWPSGLRRYVKVVVSSGAWVRTPLDAFISLSLLVDIFLNQISLPVIPDRPSNFFIRCAACTHVEWRDLKVLNNFYGWNLSIITCVVEMAWTRKGGSVTFKQAPSEILKMHALPIIQLWNHIFNEYHFKQGQRVNWRVVFVGEGCVWECGGVCLFVRSRFFGSFKKNVFAF